ncbi:MAG TPA: putative toxin-antitoxin system toxin component, PIN family [Candidatus Kapabacteria bacterium]|nr:putative toxin-antitoxin system toxin component, PIN family [Candidatus Kapabacteria bacterium]
MRIVIDTNIWIQYLIDKPPKRLDSILLDPQTEVLLSRELLDELIEVCARPKFTRYFSTDDITDLVLLLESRFPVIAVQSIVDVCRDKKDNFLLALCKDGKADVLLTGDSDILDLRKFEDTIVVSLTGLESIR